MKGYQNLHCHTKNSDGELTHNQVLDVCQENNISVVAFTDHDALPNKKVVKALQEKANHPTKWIIGIEISSGWPKELNGGATSNFHIVGLFVDPFNQPLLEHCQKAQQARIERARTMVKNLRSLGLDISEKDCLNESEDGTIGRPHIVSALMKKEKNLKIIDRLTEQMAQAAEKTPKIKKQYNLMLDRGKEGYPFFLFLKPKAFIPDIYVDYLYWQDMDKNVELIRQAGGIAVLAHWTFSKEAVSQDLIARFFEQKRLDGAEIVYGLNNPSNFNNLEGQELLKDMRAMERLTKKHRVLQSGGGDSHSRENFAFFKSQKSLASKTIGLVEKMLKQRPGLNLEFSSLAKVKEI